MYYDIYIYIIHCQLKLGRALSKPYGIYIYIYILTTMYLIGRRA